MTKGTSLALHLSYSVQSSSRNLGLPSSIPCIQVWAMLVTRAPPAFQVTEFSLDPERTGDPDGKGVSCQQPWALT